MPTYPYFCPSCENKFDVTKSILRLDDEELCGKCHSRADRHIGRVNFNGAGDWKPDFNPAFGCVVKSKRHQREILSRYRDKGKVFEEVGNEPVENIHKFYDNARDEKRKERWSEPTEKVLAEGLG